MSQPNTPFDDGTIDPFLLSTNEGVFTQEHFDELFAAYDGDLTFSSANNEVLDDLDLSLDDASIAPANSSNTTTVSAPDFSGYTFGQRNPSAYPTPDPSHPFPLQQQQDFEHAFNQRLFLIPTQTNTSLLCLQQHYSRVHQDNHRRSLSHADAERIAAHVEANGEPIFFRKKPLQPLGAASQDEVAGNNKYKNQYVKEDHLHEQSAGHAVKRRRGRESTPTPIPAGVHGMLPPSKQMSPKQYGPVNISKTLKSISVSNDPYFTHMSHEDKRNHSSRVIEIGAMAIFNPQKSDPYLELQQLRSQAPSPESQMQHMLHDRRGNMMTKLEEVEQHLKHKFGDCDVGLKGCAMIREALARGIEEDAHAEEERKVERLFKGDVSDGAMKSENDTIVPSAVFSQEDNELYNGSGDDDPMHMFMVGRRDSEFGTDSP